MKKLYFLLMAIFCAFSISATTLYLKPNSNWKVDNARFATYFYGNGEKWVSMTDSDSDGIYEVEAPDGYPNVIFCRMNPGNSTNSWDNKWNQTGDLTVPTDNKVLFTIPDNAWDGSTDCWSSLGAIEAPTFSVPAGIFADSFNVELSKNRTDGVIKYSLNDSDYVDYTGAITISETTTIKAYVYVEGYDYAEAKVTYTLQTSDLTETTLYLTPGSDWKSDNAWFAAYFYGSANTWLKLEKVDDATYKTNVPVGDYTTVIFCRMNPDGVIMTWDNRWTQTGDLAIPTDNKVNYVISNPWDPTEGAWQEYSTEVTPTFAGGDEIYLQPSTQWYADDAWFALYVYGENGDAWATLTDTDADGIYEASIPEGTWTGLIFVRQDPAGTTPSWDNLWGQTADLFYNGTNNQYVIQGWIYGSWTTYSESMSYVDLYVDDQIGWDLLSVYGYEVGVEGSSDELFYTWPGMTSYKEVTYSDAAYVEDGMTINETTYKVFRMPSSSKTYAVIFNNGIVGEGQQQIDVTEIITANKYYYFRIYNAGTEETPEYKYELLTELMTGVDNVEIENADAPEEYYNFQGVRVANPEKGMYIRVQGGKATKVIIE